MIIILFSVLFCHLYHAHANIVEINPDGHQHEIKRQKQPIIIKATFTNTFPSTEVNLYWSGNGHNGMNAAPKIFYGPIKTNGGERVVQGYDKQVFVITKSGTIHERLGEFILSQSEINDRNEQRFIINEEVVAKTLSKFPPSIKDSQVREVIAKSCRSINDNAYNSTSDKLSKCRKCVALKGCGYSPVRDNRNVGSCYLAHPIATVNSKNECNELYNNHLFSTANSKSVDAWMNLATSVCLTLEEQQESLRNAYRYSEMAVERARIMMEDEKVSKSIAVATLKKASVTLSEIQNKLEAVFDDDDAHEFIATSRHENLAKIHHNMPMVPRRTLNEARDYIIRGEPVIITNAFHDGNAHTSPIVHKWNVQYLSKKVFSSNKERFNVAADVSTRCCRYFEPQGKSQKVGYPYPFSPSTHLYRDTFDSFVKTIRKGYVLPDAPKSVKKILHYLHEIVMNDKGKATIAGGSAPQQFTEDIDAISTQLRDIASNQPFFGNFNSAKLWIGQRGIVMPVHFDATDNLYVMVFGRKRAIIGEPGQLDEMYRYPNDHPLAGSSQVNLTAPDLDQHPNFKNAKLHEAIVGPGDILYLPAWWWHQFEQPFEDTAALNLWSLDRKDAPSPIMRDARIREHGLSDQLERSVAKIFGNEAGVILSALANKDVISLHALFSTVSKDKLERAKKALYSAAESWRASIRSIPGGHIKTSQSAAQLVKQYLNQTHRDTMRLETSKEGTSLENWSPGKSWDLSQITKLPRDLRANCEAAPESSPFMSICG